MIPQLILILLLRVNPSVGFAPIDVTTTVTFNRSEIKVGEEICLVLQGPPFNSGGIGEMTQPIYYHRSCTTITRLSTGWWEMISHQVPGGAYTAWVEVWVKGKIRIKTSPSRLNYVLDCGRVRQEDEDPRCL